ncbi:MAG: DUF3857 domain-containing protein [Planctomycetota bacterium]|nr:DUF3857 domain-containing protein [Planctomycetota bacterium]
MRGSWYLPPVLFVVGLVAGHAAAGEDAAKHAFNTLGGPAVLPETERGYEQYYDGACAAAAESFSKAVAKNPAEAAALYGLGVHVVSMNEYQKGLEYSCQAFTAAGNGPWAELYLQGVAGLLPYCHDPAPFLALVKRAEDSGELRPRLKDLVRAQHARWLVERGQFAAAADACKPLQYVTRWALAGPFDNRDNAGFAVAYEPERGVSFEKPMPGRNRQVSWFRPALDPCDGRMHMAELFEPKTHVLAYAVCFVKAPDAGFRVLRVGCAGACAVWVNDALVGSVEQYNDFGQGKLAVPVYLHQGWNQVLVKTGVVEGIEWAFCVRFCAPSGGTAAGLLFDESAEALAACTQGKQGRAAGGAASATPAGKPPECDLGLLPVLQEALQKNPEDVSLLGACGILLDAHKFGDKENPPGARQLARAAALAPRCPYLRLALASLSEDSNEARQAAEAVWAAHPDMPAALDQLALLAEESGLYLIASDYARQELARFGTDKMGLAALTLANALAGQNPAGPSSRRGARTFAAREGVGQNNSRGEAWLLARAFVERHPYRAEGWQRLVELEPSQSARRTTLQKALSCCGGDPQVRQLWTEELVAQDNDRGAAEFAAAGLPGQPFSVAAVLAVARQFARAGDEQRATQLLEDARRWAPENPDLLGALALAWHHAGRPPQAVELYREVLRIKPNSPQVKDYLAALDTAPGSEQRFFAPYDIALKDLPAPKQDAYPADNIVNILNQEVVRVNDNGSCSRMVHRIGRLLRPAGLQELSQHVIYYEPSRQVVDILKAAVITPDGRELARAEVHDRTTSAAMGVQTRIYDEQHLKQVVFQDLAPGATVDLQYTIRDTGDNIYGDYFAGVFYLSDDQPTIKSQYVLDFPKSLNIQTRTFNATIRPERLDAKDPRREVLKWELNDTPGVQQERGMPPVVDQLVLLQVTTMRSWQEVGQWYWNLAQDQLASNAEMRQEVAALTRDCKTPTDKLRVIHDWVIRNIRYLGIEFGRNGYRPHRVVETFKARYGDCKDTAALLAALLKIAGMDCSLVLLRTVNAGAVPPDSLPLPNLFNHCIAYVPQCQGRDYWVDGTTDFHRLTEVPYVDQTAQVLVVDQAGGKFMRIPAGTPAENLVEQQFTARVERNGSGTLTIRDVRHGQFAAGYRELAETPGQYERYMKEFAAKRFNGAEVEKLELAPPGDQGPMWMNASLKVPVLTTQSGERKALPAALDPLGLSRYASETKRRYDLELHFPWSRQTRIVYELDKGLKVASLPDEAAITAPFATYSRKLSRKDDTLTIQEDFVLTQQRVPVGEYEAFKTFCNRIDSLMDQKILLDTK